MKDYLECIKSVDGISVGEYFKISTVTSDGIFLSVGNCGLYLVDKTNRHCFE